MRELPVAPTLKLADVPAVFVRLAGCEVIVGGVLADSTTTLKLLVADNGGVPLSVTAVVSRFVVAPGASGGVQVMMPFASMPAPAGGFSSVYASELAGMSESEAVFVTTNDLSAVTVRSGCAGSVGALFSSVTTTLNEFVALNGGMPLSVTRVVKTFVPGPWLSLGVQVTMPIEEIVAFAGAAIRL